MPRPALALAVLATGCNIEQGFGDQVPSWPHSVPPPLEGVVQTDEILQLTTPQVDILWMVDNSCSMGDDQDSLVAAFPNFMNYFLGSGLDYHIGVTSSDTITQPPYPGADGTLVEKAGFKYVDPDSPDPIDLFDSMATLGIGGRYPERGLGGTYLCLEEKADTVNAGFQRDEAALHTIIISDEPDFTLPEVITQPEYVDWYEGLKTEADMRTFSAIVDENRGIDYVNTAHSVGGIVFSIFSDADGWAQVLQLLGLQAAGLKTEYFLSHLPVPGTIDVSIEDVSGTTLHFAEGEDWTYDASRNSISFAEYIPNALSTVVLTYTLLAANADPDGVTTEVVE